MERITFDDIKDKVPRQHWDRDYREKFVKWFLSLPEEKKEVMRKRQFADLERRHRHRSSWEIEVRLALKACLEIWLSHVLCYYSTNCCHTISGTGVFANENDFSIERKTDIMKCSPYNDPCMSPSEYHQYMQQDRYMERAKLAIKEFNIHIHSDFEVVTVESLETSGSHILYHQITFTARDAKDPTAASLTFETEVTEDSENQSKLLYCKCKESGLVVEGKNMSED
ncbi:hypothetical protein OROHE_005846 [Orobanche hederae]